MWPLTPWPNWSPCSSPEPSPWSGPQSRVLLLYCPESCFCTVPSPAFVLSHSPESCFCTGQFRSSGSIQQILGTRVITVGWKGLPISPRQPYSLFEPRNYKLANERGSPSLHDRLCTALIWLVGIFPFRGKFKFWQQRMYARVQRVLLSFDWLAPAPFRGKRSSFVVHAETVTDDERACLWCMRVCPLQ